MNQIIKDENGGVFDKTYAIEWNLYSDVLIVTGNPSIRTIPIKLLEIIN
jgi:tetrahydromethanopterin S-methyltransferase subunit H